MVSGLQNVTDGRWSCGGIADLVNNERWCLTRWMSIIHFRVIYIYVSEVEILWFHRYLFQEGSGSRPFIRSIFGGWRWFIKTAWRRYKGFSYVNVVCQRVADIVQTLRSLLLLLSRTRAIVMTVSTTIIHHLLISPWHSQGLKSHALHCIIYGLEIKLCTNCKMRTSLNRWKTCSLFADVEFAGSKNFATGNTGKYVEVKSREGGTAHKHFMKHMRK